MPKSNESLTLRLCRGRERVALLRRADVRPYRRQLLDNRPGAAWFETAMQM